MQGIVGRAQLDTRLIEDGSDEAQSNKRAVAGIIIDVHVVESFPRMRIRWTIQRI